MDDGRKRRKAKQARRDVRRRAAKDQTGKEEAAFIGQVRKTLDTGRPLDMLCLAAYIAERLMPDWRSKLKAKYQNRIASAPLSPTCVRGTPRRSLRCWRCWLN